MRSVANIAALLVACASEIPPVSGDGGTLPDAVFAPDPPAPPADPIPPELGDLEAFAPEPPRPPMMTPCPSGWIEVSDHCEPWASAGACATDEAQLPGEASCTKIGTECPAGMWPEGLPAGATILYVTPGGTGDGSIGSPFGTIARAMTDAVSGTIIALSRGTFDEQVLLRRGAILWGACVAETIVDHTGSTEGTIVPQAFGTEVRNLQIRGRGAGVVAASSTIDIALHSVLISGAHITAILAVRGGRVTGDRVVIRDTMSQEGTRQFGRGISVERGGIVSLDGAILERNRNFAAFALGTASTLELTRFAIRDTRVNEADGSYGDGVFLQEAARATLRQGIVENNTAGGVFARNASTSIELEDVIIRGTSLAREFDPGGSGLAAIGAASITARRVFVASNLRVGVASFETGTIVRLEDSIVADTISRLPGPHQEDATVGMSAFQGGRIEATRVLAVRNANRGVFCYDGATLDLTDVAIDDTEGGGLNVESNASAMLKRVSIARSRAYGARVGVGSRMVAGELAIRDTQLDASDPCSAVALRVREGGVAEIERAVFERNARLGVAVFDPGSNASLSHVIIRDTPRNGTCASTGEGIGVGVVTGAEVTVARAIIEGSALAQILARDEGTHVSLADVAVRRSAPIDGDGFGMILNGGARADVVRADFDENRSGAILVLGSTTSASLTDVSVRRTKTRLADPLMGGRALDIEDGASVELIRARFEDNVEIGAFVALGGTRLVATDFTVVNTMPRIDGARGGGFAVQLGASAELDRVSIEGCSDTAFMVHGEGTSLTASDLAIVDSKSIPSDGSGGRGLVVQVGARASIMRSAFLRNRELGVVVIEDARLELDQTRIGDTEGIGAASITRGALVMQHFVIERSTVAGLQVADAEADLAFGLIVENGTGASISGPFDVSRISRDVTFDNLVNIDRQGGLPVPSVSAIFGEL